MVTRRREGIGDAERNAALARGSVVKAVGSEEAEESGFLSAVRLAFTMPELPERTQHGLHLSQVRVTSGARPKVLVAVRTLGRG